MKKITLTTRQVESLKELMNRGLAYTDMFYRYSKRMENIYKIVNKQLQNSK